VTLGAKLDQRALDGMRDDILAHRGDDLTLDCQEVTHFSALSIQLLRSAARSWAEDGHKLQLSNLSNETVDELFLLGFTPDSVTQWEATT